MNEIESNIKSGDHRIARRAIFHVSTNTDLYLIESL